MRTASLVLSLGLVVASPALAQQTGTDAAPAAPLAGSGPTIDAQILGPAPAPSTLPSTTLPQAIAPPEIYAEAKGGHVRILDKLTATTTDLDLKVGVKQEAGHLGLEMSDCRYPSDNPNSDAYAHLTITLPGLTKPIFDAWMIASAPALSALDHPRYDVWVLGCDLPPGAASTNSGAGSGG